MIYHFTALNMANLVLSINICQEYQYWFVASFLYISCHIKNRQQRNKGIVYANISTKDTSKPTIFQYINIQFINMLSYRNRSVFICQHTSQRLVAHTHHYVIRANGSHIYADIQLYASGEQTIISHRKFCTGWKICQRSFNQDISVGYVGNYENRTYGISNGSFDVIVLCQVANKHIHKRRLLDK